MDRRNVVVMAIAGLSLLGASCADTVDPAGSGDPSATVTSLPGTPSASNGQNTTPAPPASAIPEVLDFEAPLLDGGTFHGASFAGKDVAFWFWAPW